MPESSENKPEPPAIKKPPPGPKAKAKAKGKGSQGKAASKLSEPKKRPGSAGLGVS